MTELDKALEIFQQDMEDEKNQSQFFDLFLNSTLYIPTHENKDAEGELQSTPLVVTADEHDFLMLFDSEERLKDWAEDDVPFVAVPGHVVALNSPSPLHWMLNYGTDHSKPFVPDEIAWLKKAVDACIEAQKKEQAEG